MSVNAGARLDRLPISKFHWRILGLIAGGMFLDAFEIYLAGGVLGALVKSGWSDMARNAQFISVTFAGMVVGAWVAGVLGDRYGRRFSYQANLLIFGLASFAAAAAPSMTWLIATRFVMGVGLGAEIVVGYVTMAEFVPPQHRAKWGAGLAALTNTALFISSFAGFLIIPSVGWRWMFVIVGIGALFVWYLRKAMPELPRWLELKRTRFRGRTSPACHRGGGCANARSAARAGGTFGSSFPQPLVSDLVLQEAHHPHDRRERGAGRNQHGDLRVHRLGADVHGETGLERRLFTRLHDPDVAGRSRGRPYRHVAR